MKFFAVPGCHALFAIVFAAGKYKIGFAKNCVGALVANLGDGLHLGNGIVDSGRIHRSARTILRLWHNHRHSGAACQNKAA